MHVVTYKAHNLSDLFLKSSIVENHINIFFQHYLFHVIHVNLIIKCKDRMFRSIEKAYKVQKKGRFVNIVWYFKHCNDFCVSAIMNINLLQYLHFKENIGYPSLLPFFCCIENIIQTIFFDG